MTKNFMKKIKLGNSRILFSRQSIKSLDLNAAIALLDNFVLQSGQVELVSEKIYLYPQDGELLIAREISGYPSQLPEGAQMLDFSATEAWELLSQEKADNFSRLQEMAQSMSLKEGKILLRIVLDVEHFDQPIVHVVDKPRA